MEFRYLKLRQLIIGWVSYFRLADIKTKCQELDVWTTSKSSKIPEQKPDFFP